MGWIDDLTGSLVGLDSAPLIYALEAHPIYVRDLRRFLNALDEGRFRAVTSTVTLIEVLTQPLRHGDVALVRRYEALLLEDPGLATLDLSVAAAREAARLRAAYNLRTPDAAQLATAIAAGASHFLTNDARLTRVTELRVLVLDALLAPGA